MSTVAVHDSPWEFFTLKELSCPCCGKMEMQGDFMLDLVALRRTCDFPFPITSGYRCRRYNNQISTTGRYGPHTTGRAVDIHLLGHQVPIVIAHGLIDHGMKGFGVNQRGNHKGRFLHLDNIERDYAPDPTSRGVWTWTY